MSGRNRTPDALIVACSISALSLFYAALVLWLPPRAVWGGDQGMKLLQIEALSASPPRIALEYAGASLAPEERFAPFHAAHAVRHDGRWYSVFPVAYAALSVPPYRALGFVGLYVVPAVSVVVAAWLAYLLARRLCERRDALVVLLCTALGSPLVFYGGVLWEHATATALATGAALCLVGGTGARPGGALVLAGILVGLATWMRTEMYVFAAAIAGAAVLTAPRARRAARFVAGAAAALALLWIANWLLYGEPAGVHVRYNFAGAGEPLAGRLARHLSVRGSLARDLALPSGSPGWIGYALAAAGAVLLARAPSRRRWGAGLVAAGALAAAAAAGVATVRGDFAGSLLAASPWLPLLAGLAAPARGGEAAVVRPLLLLCAAYVAGVLALSPVPGGVDWGGRLFLPVVPVLVVLAVVGRARLCGLFADDPRSALRAGIAGATGAAIALGALVQVAGVSSLYEFKLRNREYADALVESGDRVFVASARWPILAAAPVWQGRTFLRADSRADFCTLVRRFAEAGIESFTYLAVPVFVPDVTRGRCATNAGYRVSGRTQLRRVSVIRGVHFTADDLARPRPG